MNVIICNDYNEMSAKAAEVIADVMKAKKDCILGLATGSTPIGTYDCLVEKYNAGELDFSSVKTFNLDEYYPIAPENEQSYIYFMKKNLFDRVNVKKENVHIPSGSCADIEKECKEYDAALAEAGGTDIQLLGIGQNGHIGFNEPDDALVVGTHPTVLEEGTRIANSRFFASLDEVPTHAVTMGMASIMSSKKILLLANGKGKHFAISAMMNDKIDTHIPATLLKLHPDVTVICDKAAYYGE
jgi:glucosamine-6-phosphate deaminase